MGEQQTYHKYIHFEVKKLKKTDISYLTAQAVQWKTQLIQKS